MKRVVIVSIAIISLFFVGCAPKVMVPPKLDLKAYEVVGVVEFESNSQGNLSHYVTQRFIEAISEDQPEVKLIELGTVAEVLEGLGMTSMGPDALAEIGKRYDIRTLITGNINFSEPSTDIHSFSGLTSMGVEVKVSSIMTVKLRDTESGATLWTGSGRAEREIADAGFSGGYFSFNSENPDKAYGKLTDKLVKEVSKDFRVSYVRQRD